MAGLIGSLGAMDGGPEDRDQVGGGNDAARHHSVMVPRPGDDANRARESRLARMMLARRG